MLGSVILNGERLMKMRNPWGKEKYTGPYHDGDSVWTDEMKQEVGFVGGNDGTFFMPLMNFKRAFPSYTVLMYQDWHHTQVAITGKGDRHVHPIKSTVSQKMIATMQYINSRYTAPGCPKPKVYYNLYLLSGNKTLKQVAVHGQTSYGSFEFEVEAGTDYTIMVKNWDDKNAENDFMINIYAEDAKIEIE